MMRATVSITRGLRFCWVLCWILLVSLSSSNSSSSGSGDGGSSAINADDSGSGDVPATTTSASCDGSASSSDNGSSSIVCVDGSPLPIENGVYVVESIEAFQRYFHERTERYRDASEDVTSPRRQREVWLVLLYDDTCSHCPVLLERFEEANQLLLNHFQTTTDAIRSLQPPRFAKVNINDGVDKIQLKRFGLTAVPKMFFVTTDSNGNSFLLEYIGQRETSLHIFQVALHFFYRLVLTTGDVRFVVDSVTTHPLVLPTWEDVKDFVWDHRGFFLGSSDNTPLPLPALMSEEETLYARWILGEEEDNNASNNELDDFVLLVQCRRRWLLGDESTRNPLYETFDRMSQVLSNRHDRLLVAMTSCTSHDVMDGVVEAWKIPTNLTTNLDWDNTLSHCDSGEGYDDPNGGSDIEAIQARLIEFMVQVCTPSILWFDRQITAPVAFATYRKIHATLFIDWHHIHDRGTDGHAFQHDLISVQTRTAVQQFQNACRYHRQYQTCHGPTTRMEQDLVCLIVPSTETRILATFDIDIWSPLDEAIPVPAVPQPSTLPTILLTDQRHGGTRRFYLQPQDLLASPTSIHEFLSDFWQNQLAPNIKTSSRGARTTESGIRILTANTMEKELLLQGELSASRPRHSLIYFTAPTCGHCKRFSVVWSQLAELLRHIGWDHMVQLYQIDVSTDEIVGLQNVTVRWVPDLYYLSPDKTKLIRFDRMDELGDDVGRITYPSEILEWFIHEGTFEDNELQLLLTDLEERF